MPFTDIDNIEIEGKTVFQVFDGKKYFIPSFQRKYTWGKKQILELWNDLYEAYSKNHTFYFLGSLITYDEGNQNRCYVIDGQQRLTSLTLIFGAIYFNIRNKEGFAAQEDQIKRLLISYPHSDDTLTGVLTHSDNDIEPVLNSFFNAIQGNLSFSNNSENNFSKNFTHINDALVEKFRIIFDDEIETITDTELNDLKQFITYLQSKVVLSTANTTTFPDAFMMFERQNDRGLEITFSEKVKHYIIGKALHIHNENVENSEDITLQRIEIGNSINEKWSNIIKKITDEADFKNFDNFLIYFLNAVYKDDFNTSDGLNVLKNQDIGSAEEFIALLEAKANWFVKIRNSINKNNSKNVSLSYIKRFFKDFKQHYQILLASEELDLDRYIKLTVHLESLIFIQSWFGKAGSGLEKPLNDLIKRIYNENTVEEKCYLNQCTELENCEHVCNHPDLCIDVLEHEIRILIDDYIQRAQENLINWEKVKSIKSTSLRYIIFRTQQQFRIMKKTERNREEVLNILSDNNDMDHILQRGDTNVQRRYLEEMNQVWNEDNQQRIESIIHRIGNLTLLEPELNGGELRSLTPSEKLTGQREDGEEGRSFFDSEHELTKVLSNNSLLSNERNKTQKIIRHYELSSFENWDINGVKIREISIFHILSQALLTVIDPYQIGYSIDKNYLPTTPDLPF